MIPFNKIFYLMIAGLLSFAMLIGCGDEGGGKKAKSPTAYPPGPRPPGTGIGIGGYSYHKWGNNFNIDSDNAYRGFLEEFGIVCNPYTWANWGNVSCKNWDKQAYVELHLSTNTLPTTGRAIVYAYPNNAWGYNLGGYPVAIDGTFEPSTGEGEDKFIMKRRGNPGTFSYNAWIRVEVTGLITDNQVNVEIYYHQFEKEDKRMGRGSLHRY